MLIEKVGANLQFYWIVAMRRLKREFDSDTSRSSGAAFFSHEAPVDFQSNVSLG